MIKAWQWLQQLIGEHSASFGSIIPPNDHKALSNQQPVRRLRPSAGDELILPLQQHRGDKPKLNVRPGDYVYKGQMLAHADTANSAKNTRCVPLHASTSGTITTIADRPIAHPSGLNDTCVILQADGLDQYGADGLMPALANYTELDSACLRQRIRDAGIVGLGGAVFPAAIKLAVNPQRPVDTLIINGAECEPYITCDDVLMRDKAAEILAGAQIMLHILQADDDPAADSITRRCLLGVEANKPQAISSLRAALAPLDDPRLEVVVVPTQYPAGGEKQLIHALTGKEVPTGGRPADKGIICHNVATARAIYRAVVLGEPLISRYVTLTGAGVAQPGNVDVPLGLRVGALLGATPPDAQLIMGGPMMGLTLHSAQIPVVKATNCILVNPLSAKPAALPCIRCGQCAQHCPAGLLPQQLYWYAQARDFAKAERHALFDCIECGCCAYVCPSHIPLVDYYRFAKAEIQSQRTAKAKAEHARKRHDFHQERLERAQRERTERLAKHKQKAQSHNSGQQQDAIQAALARAKAKKAQQQLQAKASTRNDQEPTA